MSDQFAGHRKGLDSPCDTHYSVTPSDDTALDPKPRALYVGSPGDLVLEDEAGAVVMYKNVAAGTFLPFRAAKVREGDDSSPQLPTTADDIIALY